MANEATSSKRRRIPPPAHGSSDFLYENDPDYEKTWQLLDDGGSKNAGLLARTFTSNSRGTSRATSEADDDIDPIKAMERRERNRLAARKCRAKKVNFMHQLQEQLKELMQANQELKTQVVSWHRMFNREMRLRESMKKVILAIWSASLVGSTGFTANDVIVGLEAGTLDVAGISTLLQHVRAGGLSSSCPLPLPPSPHLPPPPLSACSSLPANVSMTPALDTPPGTLQGTVIAMPHNPSGMPGAPSPADMLMPAAPVVTSGIGFRAEQGYATLQQQAQGSAASFHTSSNTAGTSSLSTPFAAAGMPGGHPDAPSPTSPHAQAAVHRAHPSGCGEDMPADVPVSLASEHLLPPHMQQVQHMMMASANNYMVMQHAAMQPGFPHQQDESLEACMGTMMAGAPIDGSRAFTCMHPGLSQALSMTDMMAPGYETVEMPQGIDWFIGNPEMLGPGDAAINTAGDATLPGGRTIGDEMN